MKLNLRNMWARLPLTRADVQTLHGMLRQMAAGVRTRTATEPLARRSRWRARLTAGAKA